MILILATLICGIDRPLNEKVVEFARSRLGQQVGNGQCSDLASEALKHAGARRRRGNGSGIGRGWGSPLASVREVQPGDILQFDNVLFVANRLQDDGTSVIQTRSFPHHTAIVARVKKRGTKPVLVILHQNADNSPLVTEWTIDLAEKRRGLVAAFRPAAD